MESYLDCLARILNLAAEVDEDVVVPLGLWHTDVDPHGFFLVDRLLISKPFRMEALRTTLLSSFNPVKGMDFKVLTDDRFLLFFHHVIDRDRILECCHWMYGKYLLVLAKVEDHENSNTVDLDWCCLHVLILDLPVGLMMKERAEFIGKSGHSSTLILIVMEVLGGAVLRIGVSIDVTWPLKRVMKLRGALGDEQLVHFQYERLPNFCYLCKRLDHLLKSCDLEYEVGFVGLSDNTPFGP
ncbi:UNVERIFIED_CONTAM: hypothetical protein Sradi_1876200 [Sesamum radiatum]|uniref:Zinc knuckle CX2CX4HX4C domain-containing protein n=1 Tax=Sesamum radiatum TaxID=300843 RepID=A0AAW2TY31_SESRA